MTASIISLFLFAIEEIGEEQQNQEGIEENAQHDGEEGIHFFFYITGISLGSISAALSDLVCSFLPNSGGKSSLASVLNLSLDQ